MHIKSFAQKHPLLCFYLLTFAISWGSVFVIAGGQDGFPASEEKLQKLLPFIVFGLASGPVIAGIVMTALISGKAGLRRILSCFVTWRVGISWYVIAFLTAPLSVLVTLLMLSQFAENYLPSIFTTNTIMPILASGIAAGLVAGLFEEPGWTGFVTPRLRARYGVLGTGLVVGLLWGLWHLIVAVWGSGTPSGNLAIYLFISQLVFYFGVLPAYRVIMVWVNDATESLFLAIIMHGSLTAVTTFIFAPPVTDQQRILYYLMLTVFMWMIVAGVISGNWGNSKQPLQSYSS